MQDSSTILKMINICESLFVNPNFGSIKISMNYTSSILPNFEQLNGYKINNKYSDYHNTKIKNFKISNI